MHCAPSEHCVQPHMVCQLIWHMIQCTLDCAQYHGAHGRPNTHWYWCTFFELPLNPMHLCTLYPSAHGRPCTLLPQSRSTGKNPIFSWAQSVHMEGPLKSHCTCHALRSRTIIWSSTPVHKVCGPTSDPVSCLASSQGDAPNTICETCCTHCVSVQEG